MIYPARKYANFGFLLAGATGLGIYYYMRQRQIRSGKVIIERVRRRR